MTRWRFLLVAILGCGAAQPVAAPTVELRPPSEWAEDFVLRQRITATHGEERVSFEAVLEKRGDHLVLVGLTPYGSRAFVLTLDGTEVGFERFVAFDLPFSPRFILVDVQRTLYWDRRTYPLPDGTIERPWAGEQLMERWVAGRLIERRCRPTTGGPESETRIVYEGGMSAGHPPSTIHLENLAYGYRLEITTLE